MDDKGLVQFVEGEIQGVVFKLLQVYWDTRGGVTECHWMNYLASLL